MLGVKYNIIQNFAIIKCIRKVCIYVLIDSIDLKFLKLIVDNELQL